MYLYIFHSILLFIWYFFFFFLSSFCQNFLTANFQQGFPVICLCLDDFCLGFQFWVSVPLLVSLVILWLWSAAVSPLIFIVYWSPVCCSVHGLFVWSAWRLGQLKCIWKNLSCTSWSFKHLLPKTVKLYLVGVVLKTKVGHIKLI